MGDGRGGDAIASVGLAGVEGVVGQCDEGFNVRGLRSGAGDADADGDRVRSQLNRSD